MADPGTVNPAVKANLEKVLEQEQRSAALRMAQIRLLVAVIVGMIIFAPSIRANPAYAPTVWGTGAFIGVSLIVFVITRWVPQVGRWGTLAVAFVDLPMLALIQHLQADLLAQPWYGIPTAVALPCALVALSTLSLSAPVIAITSVVAACNILLRLGSLELPTAPIVLTVIMPLAMGLVGATVVGRIRELVRAARKKDLVGKYILGRRLGAGGMAEVFLATYSPEGGFERKVAVKRILPSYAEHPEWIALFRREAELGAALAHPNVVQVLDFGADGDTWFIAMEFVDGVPLSRVLAHAQAKGTPLPLPVCVYLIEELCQALDYIHTRTSPTGSPLQLVHRDVNPPNVLVSGIGEVKLNDFGVARAAGREQLTEAGMLRGKVSYAAPEQLQGQPYDTRADLWALGITAFEVLALRKPFTAPDEVGLFRACLEAPVPVLRELREDLPPALEALVRGLLVRDPAARSQTAQAVLAQLTALDPSLTDRVAGRKQLSAWVSEVRSTMDADAERAPVKSPAAWDARTATMAHPVHKPDAR